MANTPQSEKRARQSERRYAVNKARRSRIRTFLRKVEEAITELVLAYIEKHRDHLSKPSPQVLNPAKDEVVRLRDRLLRLQRLFDAEQIEFLRLASGLRVASRYPHLALRHFQ